MNWNKIKTIIIIFLLIINIFFIYNMYIQNRNIYYISDNVIKSACKILAADNIIIDENTIPNKKLSTNVLESVYDSDYYDNLVAKISGTESYSKRIINNGIEFNIAKNNDIYVFSDSGMLYMKYISGEFNSNDADIKNTFTEMNPGRLSGHSNTIKKYLVWTNESQSNVYNYDLIINKEYYDDLNDRYYIYCTQIINSQVVNECEFLVIIGDDKVLYLEGELINNYIYNSYQTTLIDQINILFMERNDIIDNVQNEKIEYNIKSLTSEYYINWNQERDIMFLIPAWKIEYDNGNYVVRDAVSGSVY